MFFSDSSDDFAQGVVGARFRLPNIGCQFAALNQRFPAGMGHPNNFSFWKRFAQASDGGKGVDDISVGAQTHDQETLVSHAAPFDRIRAALASYGHWAHQPMPS